jgi:predicted exporter
MRTRAWLWIALVGLLGLYGGWRMTRGQALETDLLAMLPATEQNPVAETAIRSLAKTLGDRAVFLVRAGTEEHSKAAALRFAAGLGRSGAFAEVQSTIPDLDPGAVGRFYTAHRFRLPAPALAGAGDAASLRAQVEGRLASPGLSGVSPTLDPLGDVDHFLSALPLSATRVEVRDNLLATPSADGLNILVSGGLKGSAYDPDVQKQVLGALRSAQDDLRSAYPEARLLRTGILFYAADARQSAEREANLISILSIVSIILLYGLVFRSVRHLMLGLACVTAGFVCAMAVCLLVFGKLYLLTLVCGASVLGVAVDYAFLYFAYQVGAGERWEPLGFLRRLLPALSIGFATTALGYSALLVAPFPGMRQIAVFSMVGLAGAFLTVVLVLPDWLAKPSGPRPGLLSALGRLLGTADRLARHRRLPLILGLAAAVLAVAVFRGHVDDNVSGLVQPSRSLLGEETAIRELTGLSNNGAFLLVEGPDEGAVLAREEALRERLAPLGPTLGLEGLQAVSCFVPSPGRQEAALALNLRRQPDVARALEQVGFRPEALAERSKALEACRQHPLTVADFMANNFSGPYRMFWLGATPRGMASVVYPLGTPDGPALKAAIQGLEGVSLVDKARSVSDLMGQYRRLASWALAAAVLMVWGLLGLWRGARAATGMLAPPLLGMLLALAVTALTGAPVTLFTLMALILLLGFGIDYTVFLGEGGRQEPSALLGVLLASASTLISYGLMGFSHTPALRGFGIALAAGVLGTTLLSFIALRGAGEKP